jgi:hypothetical protein
MRSKEGQMADGELIKSTDLGQVDCCEVFHAKANKGVVIVLHDTSGTVHEFQLSPAACLELVGGLSCGVYPALARLIRWDGI